MSTNGSPKLRISRRRLINQTSQWAGGLGIFYPLLRSMRGLGQGSGTAKAMFLAGPAICCYQECNNLNSFPSNLGFFEFQNDGVQTWSGNNFAVINYFMPKLSAGNNNYPIGTHALDANIVLPYILEPLSSILNDITIMGGINLGAIPGNYTHHDSFACKFSAIKPNPQRNTQSNYQAMGESLDNYIARQKGTKLANAGFAFNHGILGYGDGQFFSFRPDGAGVKANDVFNDPKGLWDYLFADFLGTNSNESQENLAKRRQIKANVMDFWKEDIAQIKSEMSRSEFAQLQAHLDMIEQTAKGSMNIDIDLSSCPTDAPGLLTGVENENGFQLSDATFANQYIDQQIDICLAALSCGISNSAMLQFDGSEGRQGMSFLGHGGTILHTLNHEPLTRTVIEVHKFYVEKFARIVARSKEIDIAGGKKLFDDLILHWAGEMGGGAGFYDHEAHNLPVLLAGKGGGYFKTGQLVSFPFDNNKLHGSLLTNIRDAVGLQEAGNWGEAGLTGDPLTEIMA